MEAMGYGDEMCPKCGAVKYSETEEDFNSRIYGKVFGDEKTAIDARTERDIELNGRY